MDDLKRAQGYALLAISVLLFWIIYYTVFLGVGRMLTLVGGVFIGWGVSVAYNDYVKAKRNE